VNLLVRLIVGRREAPFLVEDGKHLPGLQTLERAVLEQDLLRFAGVQALDALLDRFLDLRRIGQEVGTILQGRERDDHLAQPLLLHPRQGAGDIHGVALEPADGDGLAAMADGAGGLAAVGADPSAGVSKGIDAIDLQGWARVQ